MPSGGQIGSGKKLGYATSSPHTWVTIPEVREVTGLPTRERDQVETTIHGVTSERTYIPGLASVNPLEFTLRANLDANSVHLDLEALERTQTEVWWRVEMPVSSDLSTTQYVAWQILGRVSKWEVVGPVDGLKEINVSVQYSQSRFFQRAMATQLS